MFTEFKISSIDIRMTTMLRRIRHARDADRKQKRADDQVVNRGMNGAVGPQPSARLLPSIPNRRSRPAEGRKRVRTRPHTARTADLRLRLRCRPGGPVGTTSRSAIRLAPRIQSAQPPDQPATGNSGSSASKLPDLRRRVEIHQHDHEQEQERDAADIDQICADEQKFSA